MSRLMSVWDLGRMSYKDALNIQILAANHIKALVSEGKTPCGTLLLVEHNPVFTIGLRTKKYTLEDEEKLTKLGAEFHKTDRGGLITFHGPGQLVLYPILYLKQFKPSVKWYVSTIESVVIDLCKHYGLEASTSPHTGVWVNDRKICAIGIHGSRFVMTHGLALNCNTDLTWFSHIVPCGIEGKGVTSLSNELGRIVTPKEVMPNLLKSFSRGFNCVLRDTKQYSNIKSVLMLEKPV
uniref:Octanoyl-[acyl-carrier-protein]:protein N-octanoyltransferase LIPT2, mitochondrial n=1 Tax=Graphocephala atropunctata TaxID=36148 RepID=A0A1B6LDI8_9HEMI